ncbi:MAG: S41 family peptidase [Anaerorhabdus sp.]
MVEDKKNDNKKRFNFSKISTLILNGLIVICVLVSIFSVGYLFGRKNILTTIDSGSNSKVEAAIDLLAKDWYFSKEFTDIDKVLEDKALYGITTDEIDLHTEYFSQEELESFTQSINQDFVGIGVQYLDLETGFIIEKVYRDSPASKAGLKAGDIFYTVEGKSVDNLTAEDITELVKGEIGTVVKIEVKRLGKIESFDVVRGKIQTTSYSKMVDDNIGYLEITNFGETTPEEVKANLNDLSEKGMNKLIIDLRNNGGGYLDTYLSVVGYFIGDNQPAILQKYSDESVEIGYSTTKKHEGIDDIVVLINEGTASAAEVLAITLMEKGENVSVVGVKSYGKGTVQVTVPFTDGTAIKYTISEWLSPNGNSINGVGIMPDYEVEEHEVVYEWFQAEEDFAYEVDSVSSEVKTMQLALDFLGYDLDRLDGYFSEKTLEQLLMFKKKHDLKETEVLDNDTLLSLRTSVLSDYYLNEDQDKQYLKAVELLK